MRRTVSRHALSLAALAVAFVVGVGATADHRNKLARQDRAELAEWYCQHVGTQCGGASAAAIEAHWNEREAAYLVLCCGLAGFAVIRFRSRARRWTPGY